MYSYMYVLIWKQELSWKSLIFWFSLLKMSTDKFNVVLLTKGSTRSTRSTYSTRSNKFSILLESFN